MKKTVSLVYVLIGFLIITLCNLSCKKGSSRDVLPETNCVNDQVFIMDIGHDGKTCPGCIYMNGRLFHQDCQGSGNVCRVTSKMALYPGGGNMYAVTTDTFGLTDQNYFNMPARSLSALDERRKLVYLNVPAQLVYRDRNTLQFTLTGLYYSKKAAYRNK